MPDSELLSPVATRRARAWDLFAAGWPVPDIAVELGLSVATVERSLKADAAAARELRRAMADDYTERELAGLDALERALMADAERADGLQGRALAAKVILDIKARRAKMLGLDRPAEIRATVTLEDLLTRAAEG